MSTMGFIVDNSDNNKNLKTPSPTGHSLTIGETGSGKTTAVIRPLIKQAIEEGSAILLVDEKNTLHLDLKYLEPDPINKVYQFGGIAKGRNDLSINLLDIIKSKKQFQKFADTLMGVTISDSNHHFWAKSAANMLVDVYTVLSAIKKLIQYAQLHIVSKEIIFKDTAVITAKKKNLSEILKGDDDAKEEEYHSYKIDGKNLTLSELFGYFNNRLEFKVLTERIEHICDGLKGEIIKTMRSNVDEEHIMELDRLMDTLQEQGKTLKKWKITYEMTDNSGNNGVYFSVSACLGELAELPCINNPYGDDIVSLLEKGKHVVINSESLSTQVVSILLSRVLDILSLRAKREKVQAVSVIIDEASRVIDADSELHTDFLRQARVSVHLATQHESQMIETFGANRWMTYQTNFPDIFTLSTHDRSLKPFFYHHKKSDKVYQAEPMFIDKKELLKTEQIFQSQTHQYKNICRSQNEVVLYDARLYELKENVIIINATTLEECEVRYKEDYSNNKGFFQIYMKQRQKHVEMCEIVSCL